MLSRTRTASPRGHLLLGHALALNRDPLGFLLRCARDYGDFVPLRTGYARAVLVSEPQAIEEVFVTQHPNFIKGPGLRRSAAVFGNGLLTSEGAFWRRQRRLVQPAFHRERIAAYTEVMVAETLRRMESWQDGEVRDIHAEMMPLMLQIAVKTLFGTEVAEAQQVARAMEVGQENFARWMGYLAMLPDWLATPTPPGLARAVRQLDGVVYGLIRARRESGEEGGDLLSLLLRAQDEDDGAHMTDKQLRDEVLTLLLAGHETTALALTWAFLLLARHPEASARLADELHTVLNGRSPTAEDRPQLIFTEQVILEAMRLYPPAWAVSRTALADCTIAGHLIPAGTTVMMSQYVVHRDHRFFVEPECFRPERWAGGFARALPKYAYFPFGGGPRICIGNTFALMEAALALAAIAQTYRFTLAP
ncbi:MAG TPA: cytochrome P450, partial [Chthonomonadaceae bacterium]|nr:cytochrome P450 [Chthonomonadaceae bacterium]